MERAKFVNLCQMCSILPDDVGGVKKGLFDALLVKYNDVVYYPVAYKLGFDGKGKPVHTAILHDLKTNTVINAELGKVEQK